jgi:tRNA-specific 2-thiouridylase
MDAAKNRVIVGNREQLLNNALIADQLSWVSGAFPETHTEVTARIRYKAPEVSAALSTDNGITRVQFKQPQSAIAPGQAVVFYHDGIVLGGGIIEG